MIDDDYQIISVEPAAPPRNTEGPGWHCYVIGQGSNNTIRGYRRGSLLSVTQSVEAIVLQLNERRIGKRVRVQLDMTRHRKPVDKT